MTAVEVARLKLRCDARQRDRARFAIEGGLRTTIPDDNRLTLLRRMRIAGGLEAGPARRQEAVRAGWLAAIAGARHGGADGADGANCVWFESREEAERLLLSRLLAGRPVDGWYWKLAVPAWDGRPLRTWLSHSVSQALAQGDDRQLLAIARCCVAAGAGERLVEALADPTAPARCPAPVPGARSGLAPPPSPGSSLVAGERRASAAPPAPMPLPPGLHQAVASLVRAAGDGPAAAQAILRAWALRQSPALALAPVLLAATVAATLDEARSAAGPARTPEEAPGRGRLPSPEAERKPSREVRAARSAEVRVRGDAPERPAPVPATAARARPAIPPPADEAGPEPAPPPGASRHSRHAGLWLVLPSLVRLGFREWLSDRPALLADHPGRLLLHAIARRHRVDPEDAALAVLAPLPDGEPPALWTGWWRHGLDRWLRRTARRRLHDLVNRPGLLDWEEWRVDIHYPGADADLALRRLALDRDPGWTDWLGLCVRYHFGGREDWT